MNGEIPAVPTDTEADATGPDADTAPEAEAPPEAEVPSLSEQFARSVNALNSAISTLRNREANRQHTLAGITEADRAIEIAQEGKASAVAADVEAETSITSAKTDGRTAVGNAQDVLRQIGETVFS